MAQIQKSIEIFIEKYELHKPYQMDLSTLENGEIKRIVYNKQKKNINDSNVDINYNKKEF